MGITACRPQKLPAFSKNPPKKVSFTELQKFSEYFKETMEFEYSDQLPTNNKYSYIISARWWLMWERYSSFDEASGHFLKDTLSERHYPGEPTNNEILDDLEDYYLRENDEEYYKTPLKEGLRERDDYKVLNPKCGEIIHGIFGGRPVLRKNVKRYFRAPEPIVYPTTAKLLILPKLNDFDLSRPLSVKKLYIPSGQNVKQFKKELFLRLLPKYSIKLPKKYCRLWVALSAFSDPSVLTDYLSSMEISYKSYCKVKNTSLQEYNCGIEFPGDPLEPKTEKISRFFKSQRLLVIEVPSEHNELIFKYIKTAVPGTCPNCLKSKFLVLTCACDLIKYCSEDCREKHKRIHFKDCTQKSVEDILRSKTMCKSGVVGLVNLGNTCYLNSGLQCLSNIYELTYYFLTKRYVGEINKKNALGMGGALAEAYSKFINEMWNGDGKTVQPSYIKRVLADINPIYSGYIQHDSQEVISLILDILHEDLNRVKRKPYITTKDYLAEDSFIAGNECWENYLRRNQSIIVDLLHGMYKSSLYCPLCKNTFLTYDPFCVLSLPIANVKKSTDLPVYYVPYGVNSFTSKVTITLDDSEPISEFRKKAAEKLEIDPEGFLIGISFYYIKKLVNKKSSVANLRSMITSSTASYYLMLYQLKPDLPKSNNLPVDEDLVLTDNNSGLEENQVTVPLIFGFYNSRTKRTEHTSYARVLFLDRRMTTAQVYHEVFKYLELYMKLIYGALAKTNANAAKDIDAQVVFKGLFPPVHSSDEGAERVLSNYFTLSIVNNSEKTCPYCGKADCKNCELPYSENVTLQSLLDKFEPNARVVNKCLYEPILQRERAFELEVVWSEVGKEQILPRVNKYDEPKSAKEPERTKARTISLYDCFDQFVQPDILDDNNKWFCTKCKQHVPARKSMVIYRAPPILILALKRFKNFSCGMKINELVDFPVKGLDISKYTEYSSSSGSSTSADSPDSRGSGQNSKKLYDLFAVSNHYGSLGGGHYTAFALNAEYNKWFSFDDSRVSPVAKEEAVVTSAAYVLFYRRQDVDPLNIKYEDFMQVVRGTEP